MNAQEQQPRLHQDLHYKGPSGVHKRAVWRRHKEVGRKVSDTLAPLARLEVAQACRG